MTKCPHCFNSDLSMLEKIFEKLDVWVWLCAVCGKTFLVIKDKKK